MVNNWILCSDRLPEKTMPCLVSCKMCNGDIATIIDWWQESEDRQMTIFGNDGGRFRNHDNKDIIAWMPLPEPMKEVE